jgi:small-conductance mechanosensitive channel
LQQGLAGLLSASLSWGGLKLSVGSLLAAIVILLLTFPVARLVRFVLQEEVLPRFRLPAGADHSVVTVVNYAVLALGALLAAAAAGLSGTQLTVVFGALGVGIGFGLQNIVNNFVSGLVLIFERPIKVGDLVHMGDNFGIVNRIGIRASTIRKFDGAEVLVPNGDLISKEVTNWTLSDRLRRVEVTVGVAHGTDPSRVLEILKQLAVDHPLVLESPEPIAIMIGFGENSFNFRLMAWTRIENFLTVLSEIHVAITKKLGEAGIEIPRPQRDLRMRAGDASSLPVGDSEQARKKTKTARK